MKIAISSSGEDLNADVEPSFGRAAFLLVYDTDSQGLVEVIDNREGLDAVQGAGINAAALLAQKGVEILLTGRVGPKAMDVLDKAAIKVVTGTLRKVAEAIKDFMASQKEPASTDKNQVERTCTPPGCRSRTGAPGFAGKWRSGKGQGRRGMGPGSGR